MFPVLLIPLVALLTPVFGSPVASPAAQAGCKEVKFTAFGTALNVNITTINLTDFNGLNNTLFNIGDLPTVEISGSQSIAGWYCEPFVVNRNVNKLQFLNSGITANREYWTAQGGTGLRSPPFVPFRPEVYSWVDFARRLGYPILAIDKLGTGLSSKPDPVLVTQGAYEVELYHDIAHQIKTGSGPLPRKFRSLTYVGHSYGSVIGNFLSSKYPDDFEALVLTGFSKLVLPSLPGVSLQLPIPAAISDPSRFAGLNPGYLTSSAQRTRTNSFFGDPDVVAFEQRVEDLFFQRRDVISVGQFLSTYTQIVPAPAYKGRVLVVTGEEDQAFCGPGSSDLDPRPQCGSLLPETGVLFPNAEYNWQSIPATGHSGVLHKSSQLTFKVSHEFLAGARFGS